MDCPYCGRENSDDATVCIFCLKDLEELKPDTPEKPAQPQETNKNRGNFLTEETATEITSEIAEDYGWESTWDYRYKESVQDNQYPYIQKDFANPDCEEEAAIIEDYAPIKAEDFGWGRALDYFEEKATERLLDERFIEEELTENAQQIPEEYINENQSNEDNPVESLFESGSPIRVEEFGLGSSGNRYKKIEKFKEPGTARLARIIVVLISILLFLALIGIESCMEYTLSIENIPSYNESSLCRNEPDMQGSGIALCGHTGIPTTYNSRVDHIFPLAKYNFQGAAFGI